MPIDNKIRVYNKSNELLAIFTKNPTSDIEENINMMISPTVTISQNGESTFSFSINQYSDQWKNIENPENIYVVNNRKYTAINTDAYVYSSPMVTVNLVETWYLLSKVYVQAYNVPKDRENIDEHTVILLPKSTEPLIVNGKTYTNNPYPRGSAGYALWAILQDSGWSLKTCDVLVDGFSAKDDYGVFNLETDQKDVLHNIQLIQELWGGILVWDSMHNTLSLRDGNKWDTDYGYEIRKGKNLKENVVITQTNDIVTRLYPLGEAKLNIKAVNNNRTYLENFSYTNKVYSAILQNSDIYDQKQLKFWGERKLQEICKPSRYIEANLFDIRTASGFEHEEFDLNDIVTIIYNDPITGKETKEKQRIIKWTFDVFAPYNCSVELGTKNRDVIDIIKQSWDNGKKADDAINGSGSISPGDVWDRESNTDLNGMFKKSYNYINETANGLTIRVNNVANSLAEFKVEATRTYATISALAQFKTDTTNAIAGLRAYADENFATIESFTQFQTKTTNAITNVRQYADETFATIQSFTQFQTNTSDHFTNIEQTVSANSSEIKIQAGQIDNMGSNIANITLEVNDNGSKISENADQIDLNAQKIKAQGELIAEKASISDLSAATARISTIESNYITSQSLRSSTLYVGALAVGGNMLNWKTVTLVTNVDFKKEKAERKTYSIATGAGRD